jgi:hypothetical protein
MVSYSAEQTEREVRSAGSTKGVHLVKGKDIEIRNTQVGSGVITRLPHDKHEIIGEVKGQIHDDAEYESDYCMHLGKTAKLEPKPPFRFLNHSCDPNCCLVLWKKRRKKGHKYPRLWLQTLRRIRAGEELTIDYAWPAEVAIPCQCGSRRCRGWIVSPDEKKLLKNRQ